MCLCTTFYRHLIQPSCVEAKNSITSLHRNIKPSLSFTVVFTIFFSSSTRNIGMLSSSSFSNFFGFIFLSAEIIVRKNVWRRVSEIVYKIKFISTISRSQILTAKLPKWFMCFSQFSFRSHGAWALLSLHRVREQKQCLPLMCAVYVCVWVARCWKLQIRHKSCKRLN